MKKLILGTLLCLSVSIFAQSGNSMAGILQKIKSQSKIDTQDKKLASQLFEICSREGVVPQMSPEMRPSNAEINKVREKLLSEVKDMPKEKIFSRHDPKEVESAAFSWIAFTTGS